MYPLTNKLDAAANAYPHARAVLRELARKAAILEAAAAYRAQMARAAADRARRAAVMAQARRA